MDWNSLAQDSDKWGWRGEDSCERGNEESGSIKCEEFLDYLGKKGPV